MPDFYELLRRLDEGFPVALIAQPVEVWGHGDAIEEIIARSKEKKYDTAFVGRRRSDRNSVWVDKIVTVGTGECRDVELNDLVSSDLPLSKAIGVLARRPFALVLTGDRVTAVATRADLNRLPVRVMLFTMMTHAEMLLAEAILLEFESDGWLEQLPRLQQDKIENLQRDKIREDADTRLIDCASLAHKCEVAARTPALRKLLGCSTRRGFEAERRKFVRLRNRLMHHQGVAFSSEKGTAPEDILRDALAHGDRLIVTSEAAGALNEVVAVVQRWIENMSGRRDVDSHSLRT